MVNPVQINVTRTLDATGQACPAPIIEAKKALLQLEAGEVLLLISDCPGADDDLSTWAELTGQSVIDSRPLDSGRTAYYLRKGDPWIAAVSIDARGQACPSPIIQAGQALSKLKPGEVLKLISDCHSVVDDLKSWTSSTGIKLLDILPGPQGSRIAYLSP